VSLQPDRIRPFVVKIPPIEGAPRDLDEARLLPRFRSRKPKPVERMIRSSAPEVNLARMITQPAAHDLAAAFA
jgi:hypothetical protein